MQLFNYVCIVYHMIVLVGAAQHCDSHATVSSKMSTICSSTWSFIIARGSDTRMMRSCSPLPYLKNARRQIWIEKAFAAVYPVSRAIETPSPLKDSDKASTCTSSSFECSYSQLLLMHNSPLTPQPSAWLSNLHLVIKQGNVLWLDHSVVGQQLCTQLTRPYRHWQKWAGLWDLTNIINEGTVQWSCATPFLWQHGFSCNFGENTSYNVTKFSPTSVRFLDNMHQHT